MATDKFPLPNYSADYYNSLLGGNNLTSLPFPTSGTTGSFGSLASPYGVAPQTSYTGEAWRLPPSTDAVAYKAAVPTVGDVNNPLARPAVKTGAVIPAANVPLYDLSLYTIPTTGPNKDKAVANAAIPARLAYVAGTPEIQAIPKFDQPLQSFSAINAAQLAEQARQERLFGQAENRNRGNTILAGYDQNLANNRGISDQMMALNSGYGDSMRQQLSDDYTARLAASNQSAIRRGLGNTTIRDSLNRGVTSAYDLARMQLGDQLTQRNIGLLQEGIGRENQGAGQRLGFLTGIQNDYPTTADYGNYLLQSGVLQETAGSRK